MHNNGNAAATTIPPVNRSTPVPRTSPRFLSVTAVAKALGMSEATMYRAVRAGEFPAVRVRNRYVIPVRALDALEDAALTSGGTVDAADWVEPGSYMPDGRNDRGSVPVLPLIGFAVFLAVASIVPLLPFIGLVIFAAALIAAVVAVVALTVRRDRRFNDAAAARFEVSGMWLGDAASGRAEATDARAEAAR